MNACPKCGKMAVGVGEAIRGAGDSVLACRQCGCALHFDERPLSGLALEAAVMLLAWLVLMVSCLAWGYPLGRALSGIFVFPLVIALSFRALARPVRAFGGPVPVPVRVRRPVARGAATLRPRHAV